MKKFIMIALVPAVLIFAGVCRGYYGERTGVHSDMMFYGHGMLFVWVVVFIIICAVIYLFTQNFHLTRSGRHLNESALDIIEKRYALGEISKDQFLSMKKDIERQ